MQMYQQLRQFIRAARKWLDAQQIIEDGLSGYMLDFSYAIEDYKNSSNPVNLMKAIVEFRECNQSVTCVEDFYNSPISVLYQHFALHSINELLKSELGEEKAEQWAADLFNIFIHREVNPDQMADFLSFFNPIRINSLKAIKNSQVIFEALMTLALNPDENLLSANTWMITFVILDNIYKRSDLTNKYLLALYFKHHKFSKDEFSNFNSSIMQIMMKAGIPTISDQEIQNTILEQIINEPVVYAVYIEEFAKENAKVIDTWDLGKEIITASQASMTAVNVDILKLHLKFLSFSRCAVQVFDGELINRINALLPFEERAPVQNQTDSQQAYSDIQISWGEPGTALTRDFNDLLPADIQNLPVSLERKINRTYDNDMNTVIKPLLLRYRISERDYDKFISFYRAHLCAETMHTSNAFLFPAAIKMFVEGALTVESSDILKRLYNATRGKITLRGLLFNYLSNYEYNRNAVSLMLSDIQSQNILTLALSDVNFYKDVTRNSHLIDNICIDCLDIFVNFICNSAEELKARANNGPLTIDEVTMMLCHIHNLETIRHKRIYTKGDINDLIVELIRLPGLSEYLVLSIEQLAYYEDMKRLEAYFPGGEKFGQIDDEQQQLYTTMFKSDPQFLLAVDPHALEKLPLDVVFECLPQAIVNQPMETNYRSSYTTIGIIWDAMPNNIKACIDDNYATYLFDSFLAKRFAKGERRATPIMEQTAHVMGVPMSRIKFFINQYFSSSVKSIDAQILLPNQLSFKQLLTIAGGAGVMDHLVFNGNMRAAKFMVLIPLVRYFVNNHPHCKMVARKSNNHRQLTNESSETHVTASEHLFVSRLNERYRDQILYTVGRDGDPLVKLRSALEVMYRQRPATIMLDGELYPLPLEWHELQAFFAEHNIRSAAEKLPIMQEYYQNQLHSAWRLINDNNNWIDKDGKFVVDKKCTHFRDFARKIAIFWEAVTDRDPDMLPVDYTGADMDEIIEARITNFTMIMAELCRAHNFDEVNARGYEFDDLKPDNPSCPEGFDKRLVGSVLFNNLVPALNKDIILAKIISYVETVFRVKATAGMQMPAKYMHEECNRSYYENYALTVLPNAAGMYEWLMYCVENLDDAQIYTEVRSCIESVKDITKHMVNSRALDAIQAQCPSCANMTSDEFKLKITDLFLRKDISCLEALNITDLDRTAFWLTLMSEIGREFGDQLESYHDYVMEKLSFHDNPALHVVSTLGTRAEAFRILSEAAAAQEASRTMSMFR